MLLLYSDVVVDQHLHIQPIVLLFLESFYHIFVLAFLQLHLHISLYLLHKDLRLPYLLQCFLVFFHLAENGSFVEIHGHQIVLLLILEVLYQVLLKVSRIANSFESHHEMLIFFHDAGQVIEGEDFQFGERSLISDVLWHLWKHDYIDSLGDKLDVAALLFVLDVLHGESVDLLDKLADLLLEVVGQLHRVFFEDDESEMNEFLFAEDAFDGVALLPLSELADDCPDICEDLTVAHVVVLDQVDCFTFDGSHRQYLFSIQEAKV